jgi:hypothetical protein
MAIRKFLDLTGAQHLKDKIVEKIPTKISEITNDSGFITIDQVPEGAVASTTTPKMNGTAAVGTEAGFSRGDHVHPTDTTRAAASDLTAEVTRAKAAEAANASAAAEAKTAANNAQTAANNAQADVDALEGKVGAVTEGKTVVQMISDAQTAATYDDTQVKADLATVTGKVNTLVGADSNKSVRTIANEELAAQLVPEGAKESLNTLSEIAAWIQAHPDDASAMNAAITALQNKVDTGDKNVSAYVNDAIAALNIGDYAKAADLTALAARVTTLEGTTATLRTDLTAETNRAKAAEGANTAAIEAISADYVKATELVAITNTEIDAMFA